MSPRSGFERKWKIWVKKWKSMFRKFLWGPTLEISPRGSWRFTRISEGKMLKIWKWVSHHGFYLSIALWNYLQFPNRMSRNQNIVIWGFWSTSKLELEGSQLVKPKISKWVFSHVFPLSYRTQNIWRNRIQMSITHYINFQRSAIC